MKRNIFALGALAAVCFIRHTVLAAAIVAVAALALFSCKKVTFDTAFTIVPTVQRANNGAEVRRDSVVAWGIDGDTTTWRVASFDDALNGVFTNKLTGTSRNADRTATLSADSTLTFQLGREWSMVVVCDYADSIYAFRNVQIGANTPTMRVLLKFRPWKLPTAYPYDELRWRMRLGK